MNQHFYQNVRLKAFDILKLYAIFLVLWGHSIQYFLSSNYYDEPIYRIIYSFHMPLFMMVSGFFAPNSMSLPPILFIKKKFIQLILPVISCVTVLGILKFLIHTIFFTEDSALIMANLKETVIHIISGIFSPSRLWFLKSCFLCFLLTYFGYHCRLNKYIWIPLTFILCKFIPHFNLIIMYPCFLVGMELKDNPSFFKHIRIFYLYYLCLFLFMLCLWDKSFWTFENNGNLIFKFLHTDNQIIIEAVLNSYRLVIGIVGSLSFIGLFFFLFPQEKANNLITLCGKWGQYTLGIYILQSVILEDIMARYILLDDLNFYVFNFVVAPIISLFVLILCVSIIKIMSKSKMLSYFFFGNTKV